MAGRLVTKRGMTEVEYQQLLQLIEEHEGTVLALKLRAWFTDLAVKKYMAGYHCGYKRGTRGTIKDDFDEDRQ